MKRQGNKLAVESEFTIEDDISSLKNSFKMNLGGFNFTIYSGNLEFDQIGRYTKCHDTLSVGKKPANKANNQTCSNVNCNNLGCENLRKNAAIYDLATMLF